MVPIGEDLVDSPCCSLMQDVQNQTAWYENILSFIEWRFQALFSVIITCQAVDQLYGTWDSVCGQLAVDV